MVYHCFTTMWGPPTCKLVNKPPIYLVRYIYHKTILISPRQLYTNLASENGARFPLCNMRFLSATNAMPNKLGILKAQPTL